MRHVHKGWFCCLRWRAAAPRRKATDRLIADLKSGTEIDAVKASALPQAAQLGKVVPALIEGLTHKGNDVRRSSALKLGEFHELAKDAIPALQKAGKDDGDARVREAAGIALSRIDPKQFPPYTYKPKTPKGRC